jgi:hypothetical protein
MLLQLLQAVVFASLARCSMRSLGVLGLLGMADIDDDTAAAAAPRLSSGSVGDGGGMRGGAGAAVQSSIMLTGTGYGSTAPEGAAPVYGGGGGADASATEVAFVNDVATCAVVAVSGLVVAMLATEWADPDGTSQASHPSADVASCADAYRA